MFHQKHLNFYTKKIPAIQFRENEASLYLPNGKGVELGTLYWPTPLTKDHFVAYADMQTKEQAMTFYQDKMPPPDQSPGLVDVDIIVDKVSFAKSLPKNLDFFIASHVMEHVPSPSQFLLDVSTVLRVGGVAMITLPDAQKIYDRPRPRTRVTDLLFSADTKTVEYVYYVEGVRKSIDALKRLHEIKLTGEDPHLWTFDLSTIQPFFTQTCEFFSIPLKIKHVCYNTEFEEIITFLERV